MDMNEDLIQALLEKGYIEVVGYNPAGDPLYKITPLFYEEQAEVVEYMRKVDSDIMNSLWFKGFLDMKMDEEGSAYIYLTDKSDKWLESEDLTDDEKSMMYLIYSTGAYHGGDWQGY
jgi:chromosome segregation and condensation protein ScpB